MLLWRRYLILIGLACSSFCMLQAIAGEKKAAEKSDAKTESLIEKLAYGRDLSKVSLDDRDALVTTPRNREIIAAWRQLRALGVNAFPKVIEHLGDTRSSFTEDSGSENETWTVGRACRAVLWCNLEPYNMVEYSSSIPDNREIWWRPAYCKEFFSTPEKGQAWSAAHRGKSLVDLQIEVLEWVTTHRSKRKVAISENDRKWFLDRLDELKRTRKPLEPTVPWSQ